MRKLNSRRRVGFRFTNNCPKPVVCSVVYKYKCSSQSNQWNDIPATCTARAGQIFTCAIENGCAGRWDWNMKKWRCRENVEKQGGR